MDRKAAGYVEMKNSLVAAIKEGDLPAHGKLPSERELRERFAINRNSVRHVLNQLELEGLIYRLARRGWFVKGRRLIYNPADHVNFSTLAAKQGLESDFEVLEIEEFAADEMVAASFSARPGDPIYFDREVGAIDGRKVYYAEVFFQAKLCPGILPKIKKQSITEVLEKDYGIFLQRVDIMIRPIRLKKEIHRLLGVPTGTPGLYIHRVKRTKDMQIVQIDHEYWRYDAIELKVVTQPVETL